MRTLVITLTAVMLAVAAPVVAAPPEDIRAYCAEIHRSYSIRAYCEKNEKAAKDRLYRAVGLPYGIPQDIWAYCTEVHSSWTIVEYCARKEIQAKEQLSR